MLFRSRVCLRTREDLKQGGSGSFPRPCIPLTFLLVRKRSCPWRREVPNLSLPCSRVLAGYDFIEFEFSPVCYVVYLVFRLVVEMSFSLVFFLRHSIESGVLLHFLRRYTKQFHQNIFCWVLQSLFALRSQTKAAGRS